jgi:hypothetical protein
MKEMDAMLSELEHELMETSSRFMGYPCNMDFDYSKIIKFY